MAQEIDRSIAKELMAEAIAIADDTKQRADEDFTIWEHRIRAYSELVKTAGYTTTIALLGGTLIAKGTNPHVDVMSLSKKDSHPGAYNARGPVESVLVPAARLTGFDIGSTSAFPLNGKTFDKARATELEIKGKGKILAKPLIALLHEVSLLPDRQKAAQALAAYVYVRREYVPKYLPPQGTTGLASCLVLASAIAEFVAQQSDGGGRAQVAVGGLFDAVYGPERVRVGKTNEPDRKVAGDVVLWDSPDAASRAAVLAVEVRDKVVTLVDLLGALGKLERARVGKGIVVAIASGQPLLDPFEHEVRARARGVLLRVFHDWGRLISEMILWADRPEAEIVRLAIERIRFRITEKLMAAETLAAWDALTLVDPAAGGSTAAP